ncbi:MAG: hypothetical protein DME54_04935 [Verrucomicrobia bacterium]|nr:MAG: hypothetical protein DMF09_06295 [Verrucomicrobiota bacterium]PYJ94162.1 MAG: hypothetical protein DME62_05670 [Verrucomicrobiota bacterium]PYK35403.1 MAG: hypothetical protein DME54_04935 [Verrucomicrobiota bacterium]PYL20090.1 MAG: hypothetical protein DMF41_07490 [Verrucomicrobiota bacterium]PYL80935.1 MAG: hypothetical protein DMF21_07070 [Verrucomicrobiota bacterium]
MPEARRALQQSSIDWLTTELNGFVELGSTKEVKRLIRQILRHPRSTAEALWKAVRAIGTLDAPRRWRRDVEAAFARLSRKEQRRAREVMLNYYSAIWDFEAALPFCVPRDLRSPSELMFAMDIYLQLNKLSEAKKLERKCLNAIERAENEFDVSCITEALGSFYARTRNWQRALDVWAIAPRDQPLARSAAVGRAEVFIAAAIDALNQELDTVIALKEKLPSGIEISLPGIEASLLRRTEKDLLRLKRGLERLLPEKRRKAFGLNDRL